MDQWKGRVALVTGASSGIGAATCKELVKHGMIVVGCGRNVQKLQAVATAAQVPNAAGKMHVIQCDLSIEDQITKMFDEIKKMYGKVDVCINNAGFGTNDSLASGQPEGWRDMLDVNVMALCICTKKTLELMKEKEITDGVIIHMGRCSMDLNFVPAKQRI